MTDTTALPLEVVLPTSQHAVLVKALVEVVSPNGRTTACLVDTYDELGVSQAYRAFVRQGTGIVQRLFGKSAETSYRLEVDGPVETGPSFQLPVLIAHCAREVQRLHAVTRTQQELDPDAPRTLVWATGSVAPLSYRVGEVGHVAKKLEFSRSMFEEALVEGRRIHVFVPAENADDVDRPTLDWMASAGIGFHPVTSVDEVLAVLDLPAIPRAAASTTGFEKWKGNPYRGLLPYGAEHRSVFFGRGRAREEALDRLRRAATWGKPFLAIIGRSGVGKSSLAMAGLAGDIQEASGPGFASVVIRPSSGGTNPVRTLETALAALAGLEAHATREEILQALVAAVSRDGRKLLIVDQLEELFSPAVVATEAVAFGDLLDRAVRLGVWTIATVRADAEILIDSVPSLAKLASGERVHRLDRPTRSEIAEIIEAPLAASGKQFADRSMPESIADVAATSPDSLPLLQVMLSRLFDQADGNGILQKDAIDRVGTLEKAIGYWAEEVREDMLRDGLAPDAIDRVLASLVRIDRSVNAPLARAIPYPAPGEARDVVDRLVAARLVAVHMPDGAAAPLVRFAHEALFGHWNHLGELIKRLALALALRDDLEDKAVAWTQRGKEDADLLHGDSRIEDAEKLLSDALIRIDDGVKAFVAASRAGLVAEQQRRLRFMRVERSKKRAERLAWCFALVVGMGIVLGLGYLWIDGRVAIGRVAIEADAIETAQKEFVAVTSVPLLTQLPAVDLAEDLAVGLLDNGVVSDLISWGNPKEAPSLETGLTIWDGDTLFAYFGSDGGAVLMRCRIDANDCSAVDLPPGWWSTNFYDAPSFRQENGETLLVSIDARALATLPKQGPLVFSPTPTAPERLETLIADEPSYAMAKPAPDESEGGEYMMMGCVLQRRACVTSSWMDNHGQVMRYDLWLEHENEGTVWKRDVENLVEAIGQPSATAFARGRFAVSTGETIQIWTVEDESNYFSRTPERTVAIDESVLAMAYSDDGEKIFAVTPSRLVLIDLLPRIEYATGAHVEDGLVPKGVTRSGYRVFANDRTIVSFDGREVVGTASIPTPVNPEWRPEVATWPQGDMVTVIDRGGDAAVTTVFDARTMRPLLSEAPGDPIAFWNDGRARMLFKSASAEGLCDYVLFTEGSGSQDISFTAYNEVVPSVFHDSPSPRCDLSGAERILPGTNRFTALIWDALLAVDIDGGIDISAIDDGLQDWNIVETEDGYVYPVVGDGLRTLFPDGSTRTLPFSDRDALPFLEPWISDMYLARPRLIHGGGSRYAMTVKDGECGPGIGHSLLLLEVVDDVVHPRYMLRCPGGFSGDAGFYGIQTMKHAGSTTWVASSTSPVLVAWHDDGSIDVYGFAADGRTALTVHKVDAPKSADRAVEGMTRIDLTSISGRNDFRQAGIAFDRTGARAVFLRAEEIAPESPVGVNAHLYALDVNAMSVLPIESANEFSVDFEDVALLGNDEFLEVHINDGATTSLFRYPSFQEIPIPGWEMEDVEIDGTGRLRLLEGDGRSGIMDVPEMTGRASAVLKARIDAVETYRLDEPIDFPRPPSDPIVVEIEDVMARQEMTVTEDGVLDAAEYYALRWHLGEGAGSPVGIGADRATLERLLRDIEENPLATGTDSDS